MDNQMRPIYVVYVFVYFCFLLKIKYWEMLRVVSTILVNPLQLGKLLFFIMNTKIRSISIIIIIYYYC